MVDAYEQRRYDLLAHLASFGESVTFQPIGNPARTITGIVNRPGVAPRDTDRGYEHLSTLHVTVLRDEDDATYGGIRLIELNDRLLLPRDPEQLVYKFSGQVFDPTDFGWTLEFTANLIKRLGGENVQRR